jgi:hypothetical protein
MYEALTGMIIHTLLTIRRKLNNDAKRKLIFILKDVRNFSNFTQPFSKLRKIWPKFADASGKIVVWLVWLLERDDLVGLKGCHW